MEHQWARTIGLLVEQNHRANFVAKMSIAEEEADESIYWMELLVESGIVAKRAVAELCDEGNQIVAIVVSSINTARGRAR